MKYDIKPDWAKLDQTDGQKSCIKRKKKKKKESKMMFFSKNVYFSKHNIQITHDLITRQ
jgi:hypothetical protein